MQKHSINFDLPENLKSFTVPVSPKSFKSVNISEEYKILNHITSDKLYISKLIKDDCYKELNRYIDILPFEHTIVKLDDQELSPNNYINGNYLTNPLFPEQKKSFILTQGPLDHTVKDFWRMIDTEKVVNIISIIETTSLGTRCAKYWPDKKMKIGDYEIETINYSKSSLYHKKEFTLTNILTKSQRNINHYHIYNWVDYSTLSSDDITDLLELVAQLYAENQKKFAPIVVHCSAGVGRSGTFTAVYFAYEYWKFCKQTGIEFKISIFDLVLQMRSMRYGLVQTPQQYKFVYVLVSKFK